MGHPDRRTVLTLGAGVLGVPFVLRACAFAAIADTSQELSAPYSEPRDLYAALARQSHSTLTIGGGVVEIVFADGAPGLDRNRVMGWIRASAEAVTEYFGRYPVNKVGILVIAEDGARIRGGRPMDLQARQSASMSGTRPMPALSRKTGSWSTR